jgi:hypothetical protein
VKPQPAGESGGRRRLFDVNSSRRHLITGELRKGGISIMLGDLLMEVNGKMTSVTVGKPVPEGSRVNAEVASEISGKVEGASLETHYVIIRPDGRSGYGEGRALLNTANGDAIQVHYPLGMGRTTSPGTFTVKGCVTFSTVSSDLEWLNEVLGVWEGTWDLANREWHTSIYEWEYPE